MIQPLVFPMANRQADQKSGGWGYFSSAFFCFSVHRFHVAQLKKAAVSIVR
jgi:hypothetical protein